MAPRPPVCSNSTYLDLNSRCSFYLQSQFPLPHVDILLLSRVTLEQCNISLNHYPFSLILSTSHISVPLVWRRQFWRLPHADVGSVPIVIRYFTRPLGWV